MVPIVRCRFGSTALKASTHNITNTTLSNSNL